MISNKKVNNIKDIKEFWNNRAKKYGHTGWADSLIYAFDQQARILAIKNILTSLDCNKSLALDFGTGLGDFANLLSKYFKKVIAFDISEAVIRVAKRKYEKVKNIQFHSGNHIEKIGIYNFPNETVDLILSVTVLDHIISDPELIKTLKYFQKILRQDGIIIAFEYSLDYEKQVTLYQRFMKLEEWRSIFLHCGFYLYKYYGFYHPVEMPCLSYLSYKSRISGVKGKILRLFTNKYTNCKWMNKYLNDLANKSIQEKDDFFWQDEKRKSLIKIMIFKKLSDKDA